MADDIKITVEVQDQASANIKKITRSVDDLEKEVKTSGAQVTKTFDIIKGVVGGAAVIGAFNAAANAAKGLFNTFVVDGVAAAQVQEDAINQLNTALALTGDFSAESSQDIQDFASALQSVTTVGDEVIIQQVALAKSFGATNEQAKDLVEAAVDLSAATGISLESAVRNLGKTFGGLTGELGEVVPDLKDLTKEALQSGAAIDFVANRFGGAAAAQVQTFSGAIQQAENLFGDLQEAIGGTVSQNQVFTAVIAEVSQVLNNLITFIEGNEQAIKEGLGEALLFVVDASAVFVISIDAIDKSIKAVIATIESGVDGVLSFGQALGSLASGDFSQALKDIEFGADNVAKNFEKVGETRPALDAITGALANIRGSAEEGLGAVRSGAEAAVEPINQVKEATAALAEQQREQAELRVAEIQFESELLASQRELQLITEEEFFAARQSLIIADAANQETLGANSVEIARKRTLQLNKLEADRVKFANQQEQQRAANFRSSLSTIASLQSSSSRELFAIGQAAAVAQATIDGVAAAQKALTAAPPPFNFALAAVVTAASIANIAKITSASPPKLQAGLDEVPAGFNNDTFPAFLNSGEGVVPAATNQRIPQLVASVETLVGTLANNQGQNVNVTVNADERGIFQVVRDGLESGRVLEPA